MNVGERINETVEGGVFRDVGTEVWFEVDPVAYSEVAAEVWTTEGEARVRSPIQTAMRETL